jgi:hypothetical protein
MTPVPLPSSRCFLTVIPAKAGMTITEDRVMELGPVLNANLEETPICVAV